MDNVPCDLDMDKLYPPTLELWRQQYNGGEAYVYLGTKDDYQVLAIRRAEVQQ